MKVNRADQAQRHRQDAAEHFVRAAAMLGEMPLRENVGEALFWASLGMLRLAQSDPDEGARVRAEEIIRASVTVGSPTALACLGCGAGSGQGERR